MRWLILIFVMIGCADIGYSQDLSKTQRAIEKRANHLQSKIESKATPRLRGFKQITYTDTIATLIGARLSIGPNNSSNISVLEAQSISKCLFEKINGSAYFIDSLKINADCKGSVVFVGLLFNGLTTDSIIKVANSFFQWGATAIVCSGNWASNSIVLPLPLINLSARTCERLKKWHVDEPLTIELSPNINAKSFSAQYYFKSTKPKASDTETIVVAMAITSQALHTVANQRKLKLLAEEVVSHLKQYHPKSAVRIELYGHLGSYLRKLLKRRCGFYMFIGEITDLDCIDYDANFMPIVNNNETLDNIALTQKPVDKTMPKQSVLIIENANNHLFYKKNFKSLLMFFGNQL